MNPKQRGAMFEHLSKQGRMNPTAPRVPTPHPRMIAPIAPILPTPGLPDKNNQVDPNYIGNGRSQKFRKIKQMFGI